MVQYGSNCCCFICGSILLRTKVHFNTIGTSENAAILSIARAQESLRRCGKFRHALIQTYLLLATKPNYTRGRVGCPSDTRSLKTNSNAILKDKQNPFLRCQPSR